MNYLAHAYLSFDDPGLLVGNLISDFVKGKKKYDYPAPILKGIELHRDIDDFTDFHPATRAAKQYFRLHYGLYAGAFMDVVYDYFLANDSSIFPQGRLEHFSQQVYLTLREFEPILPPRFQQILPYMEKQDWLMNYRYTDGIGRSLAGLTHRALYISDSKPAFEIFRSNLTVFEAAYNDFFPELVSYTKARIHDVKL